MSSPARPSDADADRRVLAALREGDPRAVERAITLHGPAVYGFLRRMLRGDHGTVDDLFQDTFLALARHGAHLDDATSLHRWLLVVAANRWRSYRRWRFVDPTRWLVLDVHDAREPRAPEPDHAANPEADLVARERVAALERALRSLAESDRAPMLLALDDGLTSADRAAALGVSEAAFRKRLERARARLAALLAQEPTEPR